MSESLPGEPAVPDLLGDGLEVIFDLRNGLPGDFVGERDPLELILGEKPPV